MELFSDVSSRLNAPARHHHTRIIVLTNNLGDRRAATLPRRRALFEKSRPIPERAHFSHIAGGSVRSHRDALKPQPTLSQSRDASPPLL